MTGATKLAGKCRLQSSYVFLFSLYFIVVVPKTVKLFPCKKIIQTLAYKHHIKWVTLLAEFLIHINVLYVYFVGRLRSDRSTRWRIPTKREEVVIDGSH